MDKKAQLGGEEETGLAGSKIVLLVLAILLILIVIVFLWKSGPWIMDKVSNIFR